MSLGCNVVVVGAVPGGGVETDPHTKIFTHRVGVILNQWAVKPP